MERVTIEFQFALGERVLYDRVPYTIVARRPTEGTVSTFTEYLVQDHPGGPAFWAYEPDLLPAPEPTP